MKTNNVEEMALKISAFPTGTHKRIIVIAQGSDPVVVADDEKVKLFRDLVTQGEAGRCKCCRLFIC